MGIHTCRRASALVAGGALVAAAALVPSSAQATVANNPDSPVAYSLGVATGSATTFTAHGISAAGDESSVTGPATGGGGVAYDGAGNLYFDTASTVYTVAAGTTSPTVVLGGFTNLGPLTVDRSGNVYVSEYASSTIKRIAAAGHTVTTVATGQTYLALSTDSASNLYTVYYGSGGSALMRLAGGTGYPILEDSSSTDTWTGVTVGPDDTLYVADPTTHSVLHRTTMGAPLGNRLTGADVFDVAMDRVGNLYTRVNSVGLVEYPAGSVTGRTIASVSSGYGTTAAVPAWSPAPALTPTPTPVTPAPILRARVHVHRLTVSGSGFHPGEAYRVMLVRRVLGRGVVTSTGAVSRQVRLPRCLNGRHYVTVVGTSADAASVRFRVRAPRHRCGHR